MLKHELFQEFINRGRSSACLNMFNHFGFARLSMCKHVAMFQHLSVWPPAVVLCSSKLLTK